MRMLAMVVLLAACNSKENGIDKPSGDDRAKLNEANRRVRDYAFEAFATWASTHVTKECPDKLEELAEYLDRVTGDRLTDPWGNRYNLFCGSTKPPGINAGAGITSNGPDGKPNTADDVRSWDPSPNP